MNEPVVVPKHLQLLVRVQHQGVGHVHQLVLAAVLKKFQSLFGDLVRIDQNNGRGSGHS